MSIISRRKVLKAMGAASLAWTLNPSFSMAQSSGSGSGKNLIFINLFGGCDGLGAFPFAGGDLGNLLLRARPTIGIPFSNVLQAYNQNGIANPLGFNPAWKPLHEVARDKMKIVQGYGIPGETSRSHDVCQVYTSLGTSKSNEKSDFIGFLPRVMDAQDWESFQYWVFATENASDYTANKNSPTVLNSLEQYQLNSSSWEGDLEIAEANKLRNVLIEIRKAKSERHTKHSQATASALSTLALVQSDIITQQVGNNKSGDYKQSPIGKTLRDTAKVIKAKKNSSTFNQTNKNSMFLVSMGGFDTHSNSSKSLSGLLGELAANLAVFYIDLESMGTLNNSIVVIYSEFGRTIFENGTQGQSSVGTDHGHANNTLVFGGPISGGVIGDYPTSSELTDKKYNALIPKIDYRDIFSEAFQWIGVNPQVAFTEKGYKPRKIGLIS
jgi:uncharacterized protein (DUF1501 family)